MPVENFSFSANGSGVMRPYLSIRIINPHTGKSLISYGLIDTGADECAIPAGYAFVLGHDLAQGKEETIGTSNGDTMAYAHTTTIEVIHPETRNVIYRIDDIPINFLVASQNLCIRS